MHLDGVEGCYGSGPLPNAEDREPKKKSRDCREIDRSAVHFFPSGVPLAVLTTTSLSTRDSAPQTSPARPKSCRTCPASLGQRKRLKAFSRGIKSQKRIAPKITDPHHVLRIDVDGIGSRLRPRESPLAPEGRRRVIDRELPRVPLGSPRRGSPNRPTRDARLVQWSEGSVS